MSSQHGFESVWPDEGRVTGKDDGKFGVSQRASHYLHGVTGAVLRFLQHCRGTEWLDGRGDYFALVPRHHDGLLGT